MNHSASSSSAHPSFDELSSHLRKLSCEEPVIDLQDEEEDEYTRREWELTLIGKVIADKYLSPPTIMRAMRNAWYKTANIRMCELEDGLVGFMFANEDDLVRVMENGPWLVNDYLLMLVRWTPNTPISELNFDFAPFWIKAYNIPCEKIKRTTGVKMGEIAGKSLDVDFLEVRDSKCKFLRFQALIDLNKGIVPGTWINLMEGKRVWANFMYERLPIVCYLCGFIGHVQLNCQKKRAASNDSEEIPIHMRYGPWMKALTRDEEIANRKANLGNLSLNSNTQGRLTPGKKDGNPNRASGDPRGKGKRMGDGHVNEASNASQEIAVHINSEETHAQLDGMEVGEKWTQKKGVPNLIMGANSSSDPNPKACSMSNPRPNSQMIKPISGNSLTKVVSPPHKAQNQPTPNITNYPNSNTEISHPESEHSLPYLNTPPSQNQTMNLTIADCVSFNGELNNTEGIPILVDTQADQEEGTYRRKRSFHSQNLAKVSEWFMVFNFHSDYCEISVSFFLLLWYVYECLNPRFRYSLDLLEWLYTFFGEESESVHTVTMLILAWNVRGSAKAVARRSLRSLTREMNPDVLFICETRASEDDSVFRINQLGYRNRAIVPSMGRAGGMWLAWSDEVSITVLQADQQHFHCSIKSDPLADPWLLTCIHAHHCVPERNQFWDYLSTLSETITSPWMLVGDFNEVQFEEEKEGGDPFDPNPTFLSFLDNGDLSDLGFTGNPFTWSNQQPGPRNIRERLDRTYANPEWRLRFPEAAVVHHTSLGSDHSPVSVHPMGRSARLPRQFLFHEMWLSNPECSDLVRREWSKHVVGSKAFRVVSKLANMRVSLRRWNREVFGILDISKAKIKHDIGVLQGREASLDNRLEEKRLLLDLDRIETHEETLWREKSRELYLKKGDRNTKFFHLSTIIRRRKNKIEWVKDDTGAWLTEREPIGDAFVALYQDIFKSNGVRAEDATLLDCVPSLITEEENLRLCAPPTREEVKEAAFQIGAQKAPGPDGFNGLFYHKFWDVTGDDIFEMVVDFFEGGNLLRRLNHTNIVLIPKVNIPETVHQYRPISLCNVVYKIISKTLANRLKPLLEKIISPFQGAFVAKRQISDNILLAQEVISSFKRKQGKTGWMAIKLDMSKAYDRVEWGFLVEVLKRFGFSESWCKLIFECISSTSFSFLLNGSPHGFFKPERGLRQGDPLSPYLFIIGQEVLSLILSKAESSQDIHGFKIARTAPPISHLFFADDSLLFCKATWEEAHNLKDLLTSFGQVSGQEINYDKSGVFFSKNTPYRFRRMLGRALGIRNQNLAEKYLGSPLELGRSKINTFNFLVDRVRARLTGWRAKLLAQAGRITLIKSVLASVPVYQMSSFLLPIETCDKLDMTMRNFWWGQDDKKHLHLISWDKICLPKHLGGMNIRKSHLNNHAMLSKLAWRLAKEEDSTWFRCLKAKYFPRSSFLEATPSSSASWAWKGILKTRDKFKNCFLWRIGSGENVDPWTDPWIPNLDNNVLPSPSNPNLGVTSVKDLLHPTLREWNSPLIAAAFPPREGNAILAVPLSVNPSEDELTWCPSSTGKHTTKSAYEFLNMAPTEGIGNVALNEWWPRIWSLKIPFRIQCFLWRILRNGIQVRTLLASRFHVNSVLCPLCLLHDETLLHVFVECPFSARVWADLNFDITCVAPSLDMFDWLGRWWLNCSPLLKRKSDLLGSCSTICWAIWGERNLCAFQNSTPNITRTTSRAKSHFIIDHPTSSLQPSQPISWTRPSENLWKLNFDGAWNCNSGLGGIGWIIRDNLGAFCLAGASKRSANSAKENEVAALKDGLQAARGGGYLNLLVEGDAKELLDGLQRGEHNGDVFVASMMIDCLDIVPNFTALCFKFAPRLCNSAAHLLAYWGKSSIAAGQWSSPPPWLVSVVSQEETGTSAAAG